MLCDFVAGYEGNFTPQHHKPLYNWSTFPTHYSIVVWDIQKDDGGNKSKYLDDTSHNSMYIIWLCVLHNVVMQVGICAYVCTYRSLKTCIMQAV